MSLGSGAASKIGQVRPGGHFVDPYIACVFRMIHYKPLVPISRWTVKLNV